MQVRRMDPFTNRNTAFEGAFTGGAPLREPAQNAANAPKEGAFAKLDIKNFKKDDWILLGIIGTLILEGSRDYVLLCALGYLFIMGL